VPLPVDVRSTGAFAVRFVPVVTSADGRTGNVTTGNMGQFLAAAMQMHPLAAYDGVVGQPYTTSVQTALKSDGTTWSAVLGEIEAARVDAGDGRAWYGVVNPDYTSGVAGMGYVGAPARSAGTSFPARRAWPRTSGDTTGDGNTRPAAIPPTPTSTSRMGAA
jgi:hypothetical protein